jgi:hypothetical protein
MRLLQWAALSRDREHVVCIESQLRSIKKHRLRGRGHLLVSGHCSESPQELVICASETCVKCCTYIAVITVIGGYSALMQGLKVAVSIQKPSFYNTAQLIRKYSSSYTSEQLKLSPESIDLQCIALYSKFKLFSIIEQKFPYETFILQAFNIPLSS